MANAASTRPIIFSSTNIPVVPKTFNKASPNLREIYCKAKHIIKAIIISIAVAIQNVSEVTVTITVVIIPGPAVKGIASGNTANNNKSWGLVLEAGVWRILGLL